MNLNTIHSAFGFSVISTEQSDEESHNIELYDGIFHYVLKITSTPKILQKLKSL